MTTQPSPSHTVQPAGSPDAFPVLETPTDSEDGYTPQEPGQVDKLFEEFAEDQNNREESVCVCDFMADQPMRFVCVMSLGSTNEVCLCV